MHRTSAGRSLNPFRALVRHRNFRLFWVGQTVSLVGTWMQVMAQGWLALELSNSAFLVGLVSAIGSLPILLFSLHAGVLVDRTDKLRLVIAMQSLLLVEAAVLWWFVATGRITIGWLLAFAAFNGVCGAFEIPARQSLMVDLVSRDDLHEAIALNSSGFNLARVVGPSIGAMVIARLGLSWCFALNAVSYLSVLIGLLAIRLPPWTPRIQLTTPWRGLTEGVRYMIGTPEVLALMKMVTVFSIFGVPYLTLMPVVARDRLHVGAGGYGILLACVGIGGFAGALFLAAVASRVRRGRLLAVASFAFPSLLLLFSLARSHLVAAVVLLAVGFSMIVTNALANGMLQSIVPDALRGRLMAAYSFVVVGLSQVTGSFVAGAVARAAGVDWAIAGGAVVMLAYGAWLYTKRPELMLL
ncbi:MAG: MFS transporter [Gemmatimonadaceae bacterium]